jgi:hypothetical protein
MVLLSLSTKIQYTINTGVQLQLTTNVSSKQHLDFRPHQNGRTDEEKYGIRSAKYHMLKIDNQL